MARQSLTACSEGIDKARIALTDKTWSQEELASKLEITRQPVANFFAGRPVDRKIFVTICGKLELNWLEIAVVSLVDEQEAKTFSVNELVKTARENIQGQIKERCGKMRVLDMTQSIGLDDIYTSVNILEKIIGRRGLDIAELLQNISRENFERFCLGDVREKRVPGLEAVNKYSKLMILGKPGAGKTTFLKHLAIQCIEGKFLADHIPLFITLKEFAEAPKQLSLLEYFIQQFARNGIAPNTKVKTGFLLASLFNWETNDVHQLVDLTAVEQLLNQGKLLILLDGLDEVRETDSKRVLERIREFTTQFPKNQFVITCRIASREYTFEQFTEVEIADFDSQQIASFAKKWFQAKDDLVKGEQLIKKLSEEKPIEELATNPLLLTLLCLVFEESGSFSQNRSELYKEGLDVLLKKWDVKRNIERDQVYKKLSLKRKEDLLSQVAHATFEKSKYFFTQTEVERHITQYIRNLPGTSTDPEELELDTEAVLKSIEAQHGLFVERAKKIYSFSHLTFHEYFTARKLVSGANPYAIDDKTLQALATHITEKHWREVFLLTVGMLESADKLLQFMQQKIDSILESDEKLQQFLTWVDQKSKSVKAPYKPAAVRALYFARSLARGLDIDLILDEDVELARALELAKALDLAKALEDGDLARVFNLALARALARALALDRALARDLARVLEQDRHLSPELKRSLQQLKDQLPNQNDKEAYKQWWQENGQAWIEQLRSVMIEHHDIGSDWEFTDAQKQLLQKYYEANKLLVDCLNKDCYVSREVRQEIEDTLLLPVKK